jgi:adenylate cyclase
MDSRLFQQLTRRVADIGSDPSDSEDIALQKRLAVALSLAIVPLALVWSAIYLAANVPLAASIPGTYVLLAPVNTVIFALSRNIRLYRFVQLSLFLILPWLLMMTLGGFRNSSVVIIWAALAPLAALLFEDLQRTLAWLLGFVALLIVSAIVQPQLSIPELPEKFVLWFFVFNVAAVIALAFATVYYFVGQRNFFQERSEMLLLNILPREISEALKAGPRTIAAHHDAASILFADVVNFTPMAATMTPLRLVDLLNEVFQCFDELVEKYDLEKIKTIGDCYMVASGVPRSRTDHAEAIMHLALDMQKAVAEHKFCGRHLQFRIGVNSGPVVAGVIGRKKFIYDLWGDAVNLASRMETQGQSGAIQITRNTYELVKDQFVCEPRGTVVVRGASEIEVWHVLSRTLA